jgi:hypothetical protein
MLGAVEEGILFTDLSHQSILCNGRFGELFGINPNEVVANDPQAVREMVRRRIVAYDAWRAQLDEIYAEPMREFHDTLILQNPDCILERSTRPVFDDAGQVQGRIWTFRDITAENHRRARRESLQRIAMYFDRDPRKVCQAITDEISQIYGAVSLVSILQNRYLHFHTTAGVPEAAKDVRGNKMEESYCQFCLDNRAPTVIQDAMAREDTRDLLPTKLGLTRYAGVPIFSPEGLAVGTLCMMDSRSDIPVEPGDLQYLSVLAMRVSAELEREEQLAALRHTLADTNEELTLVQRQLVQNEKLAMAGTLSASIAHDIRNILASVKLQMSLLESEPVRALAYVNDAFGRFQVLIHRLMSYARPRQPISEPVDLRETCQRVVELLSPQFKVSKINLETSFPPEPTFVRGDGNQLEHLLVNLVINALQVLPAGGVVQLELKAGDMVEVAVRDNGPGISSEFREQLFRPFASTKRDGFGLGLYSCRRIAEAHGAELLAEPVVPNGTCFRVRFAS